MQTMIGVSKPIQKQREDNSQILSDQLIPNLQESHDHSLEKLKEDNSQILSDQLILSLQELYEFFLQRLKDDYLQNSSNKLLLNLKKINENFLEELKQIEVNSLNTRNFAQRDIRFIDLFAGIGGFHFALHQLGCHCVFASEIDAKARETYQYNLQEISPNLFISEPVDPIDLFNTDITKIDPINIPDHDILCGGFPCQPFSIAGYQHGLEDQGRGDLIFQIVKILQVKKPIAFFLENVKNLYSHNQGKTYQIIKKLLESAGYYVKAKVLNTMEYGNLPQNRERLYIVGFRHKKHWQNFDFPEPTELTIKFTDLLDLKVDDYFYYNNKPLYSQLKIEITKFDTVYQWRRKYVRENKKGVCPTLTANMGTGGHNVPLIKDKKGIRKLTPTECLRLQGFPANFQFPTNMSISHQYKQVGNAVSITVVRRIAENIKKVLE